MSPKWAFLAHFGDISYNVFNRKKSSFLTLEISKFVIECRCSHVFWNNYQQSSHKLSILKKYCLSGFGVTEYISSSEQRFEVVYFLKHNWYTSGNSSKRQGVAKIFWGIIDTSFSVYYNTQSQNDSHLMLEIM